jgi:hypothetical protein
LALDSIHSAINLLEARASLSVDNSVARIEQIQLADWTARDEMQNDLPKVDPVAMAVELDRLRALKARGLDVQWQVGGCDI